MGFAIDRWVGGRALGQLNFGTTLTYPRYYLTLRKHRIYF